MRFKDYLEEKKLYDGQAQISSKEANKKSQLTKPVFADNEKEAEQKFRKSIELEIKNGHLPSDTKIVSIKIIK